MAGKHFTLALFGLVLLLFQGSNGGAEVFLISDLNADDFPEIRIDLRALDHDSKTTAGLSREDLSLFENDQPITDFDLVEHTDAPVNLIFVVDLGQLANYVSFGPEQIRRALTHPVIGAYFQDNVDSIQLLGRSSDGQSAQTTRLFGPSANGGEFISFANSMSINPIAGLSQGLGGIEDALGNLTRLGDSSTAIIFLTHAIDTLSESEATSVAEQLILLARDKRVPIYVFQTRIGGEDSRFLVSLAEETGGEYLRLLRGEDQREAFDRIYGEIASQRTHYEVTFRSTIAELNNRRVAIGPAGGSVEDVTSSVLYGVNLLPPTIELTSPVNNSTLDIELENDDEGNVLLSPDSVFVAASLTSWPDGYPREIIRVELLARDAVISIREETTADTAFSFTWSLTDIEDEGVISVPLRIRVTDELGIQALSEERIAQLNVVIQRSTLETCLKDPLTPNCLTLFLLPPLLLLTVAALGTGVLFIVLRNRSKPVEATLQPDETPRQTILAFPQDTGTAGDVLATLTVLQGPENLLGRDLEIRDFTTTLGRDPEQSLVSFYPEGDTSVSGKHCTLELYSGKFFITDNNSLNGTKVNGEWLETETSHPLNNGDEIEMGDLAVRGVKLKFTIHSAAKRRGSVDATLYEGSLMDDDSDPKTMIETDDDPIEE